MNHFHHLASVIFSYWRDWSQTWLKCSLQRTWLDIFQRSSKNCIINLNQIWFGSSLLDILPKFCYFCVDWSPNMAAIAGFSFKIEPYVKMNKSFFIETTNIIESKLWIRIPRWLPQQVLVFNVQSVWPYWKMNVLFLETNKWLNPNYAWMIPYIYRWIANTRCPSQQDNYTFDPMEKIFWNNSLMNAILAGMFLGWCSTKYLFFFVWIGNLRLQKMYCHVRTQF